MDDDAEQCLGDEEAEKREKWFYLKGNLAISKVDHCHFCQFCLFSDYQLEQFLSDSIEKGHLHLLAAQPYHSDRFSEELLITQIGTVLQK